MKKGFSLIVALLFILLFSVTAAADTNLSEMSYDDLLTLQKELVSEIMSRPEWKQVEVPAGKYTIGVDIPAGVYSVTPKNFYATLRYYPRPNEDYWDYFTLSDPLGRFEFYEGMRIQVDDTVIFAPPISLGF